jgi:hypothetical protein
MHIYHGKNYVSHLLYWFSSTLIFTKLTLLEYTFLIFYAIAHSNMYLVIQAVSKYHCVGKYVYLTAILCLICAAVIACLPKFVVLFAHHLQSLVLIRGNFNRIPVKAPILAPFLWVIFLRGHISIKNRT